MRHSSVKMDTPCEVINLTPLNPLVSKCQIKVCYVSDQPNRNKSVITKDVAREMANSLPGCPIVGFYNNNKEDFEEHSREISITDDGKFLLKDITRPYGFVDMNAKCWFQKFYDDNKVEHEYLMTEGYIWTGQYPEAKRIVEQGNNQSMELDEKTLNASWTKDENGKPTFFIINEAVISKLCILGEDCEPCFEGSNITKMEFSLGDDFKQELFSMMKQIKEILNEGGEKTMPSIEEKGSLNTNLEDPKNDSVDTEFKKKTDDTTDEKNDKNQDKEEKSGTDNSENKTEDTSKDSEKKSEDKPAEDKPADDEKKEDPEDEKKKKKYNLEEIPEYTELASKYSALEKQYNDLIAEKTNLDAQITELKEFKLSAERAKKEDMIKNTFYMLSDDDKADVISNIDNYSLDEIEAKLSILCVRNKVSFAALEDDGASKGNTTFNIDTAAPEDASIPAWVKAVIDTAKTLN